MDRWTLSEIIDRQARLAKMAVKVWPRYEPPQHCSALGDQLNAFQLIPQFLEATRPLGNSLSADQVNLLGASADHFTLPLLEFVL